MVNLALFIYVTGDPRPLHAEVGRITGISSVWPASAGNILIAYIDNGFDGCELATRIRSLPGVEDVHIT